MSSAPLCLFHSTDNEETGLDKLRDLFKDAQLFMSRSNLLGSTQSALHPTDTHVYQIPFNSLPPKFFSLLTRGLLTTIEIPEAKFYNLPF